MSTLFVCLALLLGGSWLWTPDKDRAELEAVYARAEDGSRFVELQGLRLHVRDSQPNAPAGTPTLLMLHGFASSLHTWQAWAEALSPHWRVLRIDLPGAGLTGADATGDYSDTRALQLITALLDERGVAQATVIGHSMGGRLAWRLAAEHPQRVHKLVLIAPIGLEPGPLPEVPAGAQLLRHVLPRAVLQQGLESAYGDPTRLAADTVTRYHDMLLAPQVRDAMLQRVRQPAPQDAALLLPRITAPTLLLWGELDRLLPPARAQDFQRLLPQARVVELPGLGHVPHEEAPALALAPLQAFLAD